MRGIPSHSLRRRLWTCVLRCIRPSTHDRTCLFSPSRDIFTPAHRDPERWGRLEECAEFDFSSTPISTSSFEKCTRILIFTASNLAILKEQVTQLIPANTWVSTSDCLTALIWVAIMRARKSRLPESGTARFTFAVDARNKVSPPLMKEYIGNAIVHTVATCPLSALVAGESINPSALTTAAIAIRAAVRAVDASYISRRLALFAGLPDTLAAGVAYKRAADCGGLGLDFSSWREQIAGIKFAIPGVGNGGYPEAFRKTWSASEGAVNVMPKCGGGVGDDRQDYEVLLGLNVHEMRAVCMEAELGGWAAHIVS